jgi:hypothetical protein
MHNFTNLTSQNGKCHSVKAVVFQKPVANYPPPQKSQNDKNLTAEEAVQKIAMRFGSSLAILAD